MGAPSCSLARAFALRNLRGNASCFLLRPSKGLASAEGGFALHRGFAAYCLLDVLMSAALLFWSHVPYHHVMQLPAQPP